MCDLFLFFAGFVLGWALGVVCGWVMEEIKKIVKGGD